MSLRELRSRPGRGDVGGHVGRAMTSDQLVDVNAAELWLTLDGSADYDATTASVDRPGRSRGTRACAPRS